MDDYWDEDFDNNKNCEQEEKITKLLNEVNTHDKYSIVIFSAEHFDHVAGLKSIR